MTKVMRTKKLGRGLEALFSQDEEMPFQVSSGVAHEDKLIPVTHLHSGPFQPRKTFDEEGLEELSRSIAAHGLMQPIVVRPARAPMKGYEIIAGERRWRAAQKARLEWVNVRVVNIGDEKALTWGLIENMQRCDLDPIEKAEAMSRFIREFKLTHEKIAEYLSCSRAAVTNLLRLLQLSPNVIQMVRDGQIDMGHARCLLSLPSSYQLECARYIFDQSLSVREAEQYVQKQLIQNGNHGTFVRHSALKPDELRLQERLSDFLGIHVVLKIKPGGGGMIAIQYKNLDELSGVLERIGVAEEV